MLLEDILKFIIYPMFFMFQDFNNEFVVSISAGKFVAFKSSVKIVNASLYCV